MRIRRKMRRKKRPPETPYTMAEVMEMETESTMTHHCLMMILMIPEMRGVTVLGIGLTWTIY